MNCIYELLVLHLLVFINLIALFTSHTRNVSIYELILTKIIFYVWIFFITISNPFNLKCKMQK